MESAKQEVRLAMSVEEIQRMNAMDNAVRHRLKEETADDVVKSAKKYLDFLQGK
jgi:hypothetical protein